MTIISQTKQLEFYIKTRFQKHILKFFRFYLFETTKKRKSKFSLRCPLEISMLKNSSTCGISQAYIAGSTKTLRLYGNLAL